MFKSPSYELHPGLFTSIHLRNENTLQDTLRLLTLWFKYGDHVDVSQAMSTGFVAVEVDTWLEVIPQVSMTNFIGTWALRCSRSSPVSKPLAQTYGGTSIGFSKKSESTTHKPWCTRLL